MHRKLSYWSCNALLLVAAQDWEASTYNAKIVVDLYSWLPELGHCEAELILVQIFIVMLVMHAFGQISQTSIPN